MLGISAYFQDLDYDYLTYAASVGAKYLFTSLHIPEENLSGLHDELPRFFTKTKELGLELIPDISPLTFAKFDLQENDYHSLKEMGFTTLRLDYGFDDLQLIKRLLEDFNLILNASTVDEKYIKELLDFGLSFEKVAVMHNFYPKTETGLSTKKFEENNSVFKKHGIRIMAFVPGDDLKRFPLYEGLPTLEEHRYEHPYVAAVELVKKYGVDDVIIGDSKAKQSTLNYIAHFLGNKVISVPAIFDERATLLNQRLRVRKDASDLVIRLAVPRVPDILIKANNGRPRGTITIENKLAGRYSGEVQIARKNLSGFKEKNVLGYVHPAYLGLLEWIDSDSEVAFIPFILDVTP